MSVSTRGGRRPGAGRPKGSKNKIKHREAVALTSAMATACLGVPKSGVILPALAPTVAPPGIAPLDLILATMRGAWEAAHKCAQEADEIEARVPTVTEAEREGLQKQAREVRLEAGRHVSLANAAAKEAAPYIHSRLQSTDQKVAGNITVEIRQF